MPIRNPFARRPGSIIVQDENERPEADRSQTPTFERVDTVGSKASSILSIRTTKSRDTGEYKMSVVNDSGVYLPPSPTEAQGVWPRKHLSRNSSDTRSSFGDIEHFSISRESFDSYRRSFDISARSPISPTDVPTRQSLDSARFPRLPRSALDRSFERQPPTAEEGFEDVGLEDKPQPRKRGFFSKFSESQDPSSQPAVSRFLTTHSRKRAPSGQGAELGSMHQPQVVTVGQEMR